MKAVLEFSLPEEEEDFRIAVNATLFQQSLWDIDENLRLWLKHGHEFTDTADALQAIRDMIPSEIYE